MMISEAFEDLWYTTSTFRAKVWVVVSILWCVGFIFSGFALEQSTCNTFVTDEVILPVVIVGLGTFLCIIYLCFPSTTWITGFSFVRDVCKGRLEFRFMGQFED